MTTTGWKHDDLQEDLAAYLRGNTDRMVWTNMQMGPAGSPRPDVFTLQKSYTSFKPISYECKISTSDFRSDVTAGKWQSYLRFSTAVVFAAPAGLLKKDDVPHTCGLIVRHDSSWRYLKKPAPSVLNTLDRDAWMKLLIDGVGRAHQQKSSEYWSEYATAEKIRQRVGNEVAEYIKNKTAALHSLESARKRLAEIQTGIELKRAEMYRAEVGAYEDARKALARALHADESSSLRGLVSNLETRVNNMLVALSRDQEVLRLRSVIENIESSFANALREAECYPHEAGARLYWHPRSIKTIEAET